jgi:Fur family ferric uptake transcriptional regulator
MQENNLFPLFFAKKNEIVRIAELRGGRHFKDKCINQGIIPGQKVEVLNNTERGPYIIGINNSRVIIGHGMLNRILVQKK